MALLLVLLPACLAAQQGSVYYVAPKGSDATGDGSASQPWATLAYAVKKIPDNGSTVLVRDGIYGGRVRMNRRFTQRAVFRAENPYRARLEHASASEPVVTIYGGANFELSGFEITRPSPEATGVLVVHVQGSGLPAEDIVLRNNILHDSYNNDLLKVNNGARNILVEGNVFYNQTGNDEHIDVNGVTDLTVRDNIFFNDFAGSGRVNLNNTASYIVIKNSGGLPENRRIQVQRNLFLNWEGSRGYNFVLLGEDGKPYYEADEVLIENNLMIGNSANVMRAPLGIKGARLVTFRNNTVVGALPAKAFGMRITREGENPVNDRIYFYNNIWSNPTGTMQNFSDGEWSETTNAVLCNNLYWNNGARVPVPPHVLKYTDDRRPTLGDPVLGIQRALVLPRWTGRGFLSGRQTIREEFERLVKLYGTPGPNSAALARSDPTHTPADDILGQPRGSPPDLGARQVSRGGKLRTPPASVCSGRASTAGR